MTSAKNRCGLALKTFSGGFHAYPLVFAWPGNKIQFQGLPSRICWLGYGRFVPRMGFGHQEMVRAWRTWMGPIAIWARDHLDTGSVGVTISGKTGGDEGWF